MKMKSSIELVVHALKKILIILIDYEHHSPYYFYMNPERFPHDSTSR